MSGSAAASVHAALATLRRADSARYALGRFCGTLAWQMMAVAVGWHVYALTHDPLALGLAGLSSFLPFVALVLVAATSPTTQIGVESWSAPTAWRRCARWRCCA